MGGVGCIKSFKLMMLPYARDVFVGRKGGRADRAIIFISSAAVGY